MRWAEFAREAPELAALSRRLLEANSLAMLGTIRRDGSARISPCEVYFVQNDLLLGMMWQSKKAQDLVRDPRIVVHSAVSTKDNLDGDAKLYGRAVDVPDPALRSAYSDTLQAAIDWRPTEPYHLFALDVEQAGFIRFERDPIVMRWTPAGGVERLPHPDEDTASS
jgi:hypothetical protein